MTTPWGKTDTTEAEYSRHNRIERADVYVKAACNSAKTYPFVNSSNQLGDEIFGLLMAATHVSGFAVSKIGPERREMMHDFMDAVCDVLDKCDELRERENA